MKKRNLVDKIVFHITKTPESYQRVKKPPKSTLQKLLHPKKARQQQYNDWCKRNGVYCGSYLPSNPDLLLKKGWKETTSPKNKTTTHREFQRKSNNQMIRYDDKIIKKGKLEDEHYHWDNANNPQERRNVPNNKKYKDRYGNPCAKGSPESHLAPKDQDYNYRK